MANEVEKLVLRIDLKFTIFLKMEKNKEIFIFVI